MFFYPQKHPLHLTLGLIIGGLLLTSLPAICTTNLEYGFCGSTLIYSNKTELPLSQVEKNKHLDGPDGLLSTTRTDQTKAPKTIYLMLINDGSFIITGADQLFYQHPTGEAVAAKNLSSGATLKAKKGTKQVNSVIKIEAQKTSLSTQESWHTPIFARPDQKYFVGKAELITSSSLLQAPVTNAQKISLFVLLSLIPELIYQQSLDPLTDNELALAHLLIKSPQAATAKKALTEAGIYNRLLSNSSFMTPCIKILQKEIEANAALTTAAIDAFFTTMIELVKNNLASANQNSELTKQLHDTNSEEQTVSYRSYTSAKMTRQRDPSTKRERISKTAYPKAYRATPKIIQKHSLKRLSKRAKKLKTNEDRADACAEMQSKNTPLSLNSLKDEEPPKKNDEAETSVSV